MHTSKRPRIGIPIRLSTEEGADARVGEANELFGFIVQLLSDSGAVPVQLDSSLTDDPARLGAELPALDGVLLPGGGDVDPHLYGQEPIEACYDVNPAQDALDLAVVRAALGTDLPVLGICRGHQLLNVVYGGTLIQDMAASSVAHNGPSPDEGEPATWVWHDVGLAAGSKVAALYGAAADSRTPTRVRIASGHHQAVDVVGQGLEVTGVADDGTIEALEDPERWLVTMQWHPEARQLPDAERLAPFTAFVAVCRDRMK